MKTMRIEVGRATLVVVPPGTLVQYEGVGIFVNCNYNDPEFGSQPYVSVNTEELDPAHDRDGTPQIAVHLNDAALYDNEGAGDRSDVMLKLRDAHEAAKGNGDQGAFDVWNVVAGLLEQE